MQTKLVRLVVNHEIRPVEMSILSDALLAACISNHFEVAELLLSLDASALVEGDFGWTALHHACFHKNPRLVKLLLEEGAPSTRGAEWET